MSVPVAHVAEPRRSRRIAGIVLATALLAVACQQALGIDGTVNVSTDACGLALGAGDCRACVASKCCAEATACAGDPGCGPVESCALACGSDYTCRAQCSAEHPSSGDALAVMDHCAVTSCSAECGISCDLLHGLAPPAAATACSQCLFANDCSAAQKCFSDLECIRSAYCLGGCSTRDCQEACLFDTDGGLALASFGLGLGSHCVSACSYGSNWSCAGKVTYPLPKTETIRLTLTVQDMLSHMVFPGIEVKACDMLDLTCAAPIAAGTTDSSGNVVLDLGNLGPTVGFAGYFDLSSPSSEILPYLAYLNFPLTEPTAQLTVGVPSSKTYQQLVATSGITPDPNAATVIAFVADCALIPAAGVAVTAGGFEGGAAVERYLNGGSLAAGPTATDALGIVFFFDVPGNAQVSLQATPNGVGRSLSHVQVSTRPKTVSGTFANPTP
jgi:hypothetical protein